MPLIRYVKKRFSQAVLRMIEQANDIIKVYADQGYDLTLRQLYYQFVSRDIIPNTQKEYKRLGSIINDARLAGLIDWDHITDRTRNLHSLSHWSSVSSIIGACASQYRIDKWANQKHRIEVWIEKEALAGVFQRVCDELDIPFFACRGYTSQSEMWAAGQRLNSYIKNDKQKPIILHFGDHDPSGIDMSRDIIDRLEMFSGGVSVQRLALNMDQIEQYDPPPNPAKATDARFASYVAVHGDECWELDALEPQVLADLVRDAVAEFRDEKKWKAALRQENVSKARLEEIAQEENSRE
jgi:hypothetical protein